MMSPEDRNLWLAVAWFFFVTSTPLACMYFDPRRVPIPEAQTIQFVRIKAIEHLVEKGFGRAIKIIDVTPVPTSHQEVFAYKVLATGSPLTAGSRGERKSFCSRYAGSVGYSDDFLDWSPHHEIWYVQELVN